MIGGLTVAHEDLTLGDIQGKSVDVQTRIEMCLDTTAIQSGTAKIPRILFQPVNSLAAEIHFHVDQFVVDSADNRLYMIAFHIRTEYRVRSIRPEKQACRFGGLICPDIRYLVHSIAVCCRHGSCGAPPVQQQATGQRGMGLHLAATACQCGQHGVACHDIRVQKRIPGRIFDEIESQRNNVAIDLVFIDIGIGGRVIGKYRVSQRDDFGTGDIDSA